MTKEIKQYKVIFATELLNISPERIYLAWSTCDKIFFFPMDGLKTVNGITLDIFAPDGWDEFFYCRGDIMFRPVFFCVVSYATDLIALLYQRTAYLETHTSTATLVPHIVIIAPCSITFDKVTL
jgi:hypothetical protein